MANLKKVALIYDFDSTLIDGNMQDHSFMEAFGVTADEYWARADQFMQQNDVDGILTAMYMPIMLAKEKGVTFDKAFLQEHGRKIDSFYKGVVGWFDRINEFGRSLGLDIRHYIISAGFQDMIENSAIASKIDKIFGCRYVFDGDGKILWPAYMVNYTQKTQYLSRISKNLCDVLYDSASVNRKVERSKQYIPYSRMIYFGDGETDVPSMCMLKSKKGYSICVKNPKSASSCEVADELLRDGRVDYAVAADYSEGSELDATIKLILSKME